MAVELTSKDIITPVKQSLGTPSPALNSGVPATGNSMLDGINQALSMFNNILVNIKNMKDNTQKLNTEVQTMQQPNTINITPPAQQPVKLEVKINFNNFFSELDDLISKIKEADKNKTVGEFISQYQNPVMKTIIQNIIINWFNEKKERFLEC